MAKQRRKLSNKRVNNAVRDKDQGGSRRREIINWNLYDRKFPTWAPKVDEVQKFNIVPFEIKSKLHPLVHSKEFEVGDLDFMLDVFVHRYVGPDKADVLCPKMNYGKRCPLCEATNEAYDRGDKETAGNLKASRRVFLNIQPVVKGEPQPLHVFSGSHYLFAKELLEEANVSGDGKESLNFADPVEGKLIQCRTSPGSFKDTIEFKSFRFLDREEELEDALIDEAIAFDEHLVLLSAEEIEAIMVGQEEEEEEVPAPKSRHHEEEEEEEEIPASKSKSRPREQEEEEEEEIPASKSKPKADKCDGCPYGHNFGDDCDIHNDCRKCEVWDACNEAAG